MHFYAGISDDLLCIHHGLSESGTVPAPSAAPPDVLYDKRNSKTFGTEDQRQNLSPVAGEYRGCDMFSDPCRRHNRYGICTGTSRISGDRTGTEIVPVLFVYTMSQVQMLYKVYRVGRSILLDHSMRGEKMSSFFHEAVEENPIIAAVKNMDDLKSCCSLKDIRVVFILFGDVCSIREIVQKIKDSGKVAMVHVDLISGLSSKEIVVDFIRKNTEADGIISTKAALIKRVKELKMFTVLWYFLLDSMAYENIRQQQHAVKPDYIEVLPGVMPKGIGKVCKMSKTPIIAGGLISDKESVMAALSAGAIAVSSTNHEVWKL